MSAEQRKLANSLRARKAHVTTRGRHLQESLDALTNVSPAILCSRLKESLSRYEGAVKGVEETYILLEEQVDEATYNDWVAKHQEYIAPCEARIAEAVQKIAAWEEAAYAAHTAAAAAPQRQQQGAAPPREPQAKAVDALRPETLEEDTSALAYSSFKDKYRRYFSASNFHILSIPQQQAYLLSALGDSLAIRLKLEDTDGLEACLTKLNAIFDQRYPWIRKLMDCMRYKQGKTQNASEFITGKARLQRESGMMEMSVEKLAMADILASMEDPELIDEVLKLDLTDATVDTIWEAGVKYDTRQASKKALSNTTSARRMKTMQCFKCGENGHFRDSCTKKVQCSVCSSSNHCDSQHPKFKSKASKHQDGGRSRTKDKKRDKAGKPGNTPAPSPKNSPTSSRETSRSPSPAKAKVARHKCSITAPQRSGKTGLCKPVTFQSASSDTPPLHCTIGSRASRQNLRVAATPDSGCTKGVARSSMVKQCGAVIEPTSAKLEAANGASMKVLGEATLFIKVKGVSVKRISVLVSDDIGNDEILLSWRDLITLRVLPENFPCPQPEEGEHEVHQTCSRVKPSNDQSNTKMEALHAEYDDVFSDRLLPGKRINMEPVDIVLEEGAKPKASYHCKQYPLHLAEQAEELIAKLVANKVLERCDTPTEWCAPSQIVQKGNGGVRLVTNFQYINQFIKRPVMPDMSVSEVRQKIKPESKVFARYDAVSGFFQVPLSESSKMLTATILPSGRYVYCNPPMGMSPSGDFYNQCASIVSEGVPGLNRTVDDVLIEAPNYDQLEVRCRQFLSNCRQWGLTLSDLKIEYGTEVSFGGFIVTSEGCRPDPGRVESLRQAEPPKDQGSLKSFLGAVQVLNAWIPDLAELTGNLRKLLKKNTAFIWIPEVHGEDFNRIKEAISEKTLLSAFDKSLQTFLYTDGSTINGCGWCLMQKTKDGQWRLIQCGSISLKDAERRYSVIDTELLAMTYGILKCSYYLKGCRFTIVTDHRPLVGLSKKGWDQLTARQARLFEKIQGYRYEAQFLQGKYMYLADFLSRSPVWRGSEEQRLRQMMNNGTMCARRAKLASPLVDDGRFDTLLLAAKNDQSYQSLIQAVAEGKTGDNMQLGGYGPHVTSMELVDDIDSNNQLLSFEGKLVIPETWVSQALDIVHSHHLGLDLTLQNARALYWWPQMKAHIKDSVDSCSACSRHQRLAPELPWMKPQESYFHSGPNFRHCIDMFTLKNEKIMLLTDWWSGMTWVRNFGRHPTTKDVTDWLEHLYLLQGAPSFIRHDGGETFRAKWTDWCRSMGIKSQLSSAYTPTSNGCSEGKVGVTKRTLIKMVESGVIASVKDNMELSRGLCRLMMVPKVGGLSAADLFYGRKVRSPLFPDLVDIGKCRITDEQWNQVCEYKEHKRAQNLQYGPKGRKSSTQLSFKNDYILESDNTAELKVGDDCLVYDVTRGMWTREARVSEVRPSGRSYWVTECSTGRRLLRSRRHLRRMKGRQQECAEALKRTATREQSTSSPSLSSRDTCHLLPCSTTNNRPTSPKSVRFALGTKRS